MRTHSKSAAITAFFITITIGLICSYVVYYFITKYYSIENKEKLDLSQKLEQESRDLTEHIAEIADTVKEIAKNLALKREYSPDVIGALFNSLKIEGVGVAFLSQGTIPARAIHYAKTVMVYELKI